MPDIDVSKHESQNDYYGRTPSNPVSPTVNPTPAKLSQEHVVHVTPNQDEAESIASNIAMHFRIVLEGKKAWVRPLAGQFLVEIEINETDNRSLQRIFDFVRGFNIGRESRNHF